MGWLSNPNPLLAACFLCAVHTMFVVSVVAFQDMGDGTSVSLLNLDPSEDTPEVFLFIFLLIKVNSCIIADKTVVQLLESSVMNA